MNEQNLNTNEIPIEPPQSSKMIWLVIAAVVITAIVVGGGVYAWQKSSLRSTEQSLQQQIFDLQSQIIDLQKSTEATATTTSPISQTWQKYQNSTYGFEFDYPADSTIETQQSSDYQYIRLQNYIPTDDRLGLATGEYYLEIFIFDHQKGQAVQESCAQRVVDGQKVDLGTVVGYRGYGQEGGDAGGFRFALCFQDATNTGVDYYIEGTENDKNAPIVKIILDSFRFTE